MIDLVLYAPTRQDLVTWGKSYPPGRPLVYEEYDEQGQIVNRVRDGLEWSWWAGNGNFKTANGTYDENGNELTAPTYATGVVMLMRIHGSFFDWDGIEDAVPADPDDVKEWERSRVARYIQENGTPGTMAGIPYYELGGVRILRRKDVNEWIAARNIAGHGFL